MLPDRVRGLPGDRRPAGLPRRAQGEEGARARAGDRPGTGDQAAPQTRVTARADPAGHQRCHRGTGPLAASLRRCQRGPVPRRAGAPRRGRGRTVRAAAARLPGVLVDLA